MLNKIQKYASWGMVAVLVIAVGVLYVHLDAAQGAVHERDLLRDSLEAAQDSTRELTDSLESVSDSARVWQRRAIQTERERDALDEELDVTTVALQETRIRVERLRDTLSSSESVTEDVEGVRHASIHLRPPPFEGDIFVAAPAPPDSASWDIDIGVIPFQVEARIACQDRDDSSVRPASVVLTTPDWISADLSRVEQAPGVCNPAPSPGFSLFSVEVPPGPVFGGIAGGASGWVVGGDPEDAALGAGLGVATGWLGEKALRGLGSVF